MRSAWLIVDSGTLFTNDNGRSTVPLNSCHEFDATVTVPMVVPVDEIGDAQTGLLFGGKWLARVIRPILTTPRDFVYTVLNSDSEYGLSFETRGRENDLSTPSSSSRLSSVAARIGCRYQRGGSAAASVSC